MAEADHDDTSSKCEWVSPREFIKRIAGDPAAETEAEYSVAERFRCGNLRYRYRYRAGNGELHHDDLSDEFRREAEIDVARGEITRHRKCSGLPTVPIRSRRRILFRALPIY
jgi:hypothetical protein